MRSRRQGTYLLDTNIVSDLIRHPEGPAARRIAEVGAQRVSTSIIVAAELRFGARKRGAARLEALIAGVLERMGVLPFAVPADAVYARLRADLERRGQPIGGNDLLIAAHAVALGRVLVTDNEREFARVAGLEVENWLGRR